MTRETEDRNRDRQRKGLEPIIPNEGIRVQLGRRMSVLYGPTSMTSDGFKTKRKAHEDDGRHRACDHTVHACGTPIAGR